MIAITFALPAESSGLMRRMADRRTVQRGGLTIQAGRVGGREVEILHTGVGEKASRDRMQQYLSAVTPALLISSGFAGAARSNYRVGDLVIAQNFSDSELMAVARRKLREQNIHVVRLLSSPRMIDS